TMLSGAAVCAAMGSAAQRQKKTVKNSFFFILYIQRAIIDLRCALSRLRFADRAYAYLFEQFGDFRLRDERWASKRSRLLIFIRPARRRVRDFLAVINTQTGINRRSDVIHHGLFFIFPTHIDNFGAGLVRLTDDPSRFDASAQKQIRETLAPVITAARGVHV